MDGTLSVKSMARVGVTKRKEARPLRFLYPDKDRQQVDYYETTGSPNNRGYWGSTAEREPAQAEGLS